MLHDQTQQVNCAGNFRVLVKSFAWQCHDRDGACLLCHHRKPNTKQKEFLSINCYGCNQIQLTHPPVQRTNLAQHLVAKNITHGYMDKSYHDVLRKHLPTNDLCDHRGCSDRLPQSKCEAENYSPAEFVLLFVLARLFLSIHTLYKFYS